MKKLFLPMAVLAIAMLLNSCGSTKRIVYFQGIDNADLEGSRQLPDARIMPKDMLMINVSTTEPDAAKPFNIYNQQNGMNMSGMNGVNMYGYLVDNQGNVKFPVVGLLHVEGLTTRECEALIQEKIKPYLAEQENPVVTVRLVSYTVTIIGETGSSVLPVTTEKMSIVDALASSGDLTIYGKRDNILLVRTDKYGMKTPHRLDISKADIFNSPYYYLQQNDIIYVEPNKTKINQTAINNASIWFSAFGMVTSVATLVVAITK